MRWPINGNFSTGWTDYHYVTTTSRYRRVGAIGVVLAGLLTTSACSSSAPEHDRLLDVPVASHVTLTSRVVGNLGRIVVDGQGHVLYMFPPDAGSQVSCTGTCAGVWPPEAIEDGHPPTAGGGVNAADLSTLADPNTGQRVVTYLGYPLYRYSGDVRAGVADGQGLFDNGGPWYVLTPAGLPVTKSGT